MKIRAYLTGLFFVVCLVAEAYAFVSRPCETPKGWAELDASKDANTKGVLNLKTDTIRLGQPFTFKFALCGEMINKPDRVTASAIMPAHQHGMNYNPTVTYDEAENNFEIADFLFHMPGLWEITVSSYEGEEATHYTKKIMIK